MATVTAEEALRDAGLLGDDIVANGRTGVSYVLLQAHWMRF